MGIEVVLQMLNPINLMFTPDGSFRLIESVMLIGGIVIYVKFFMNRHKTQSGQRSSSKRSANYTVR